MTKRMGIQDDEMGVGRAVPEPALLVYPATLVRMSILWIGLVGLLLPACPLRGAVGAGQNQAQMLEWSTLTDLPDPLGRAGVFAGVHNDALIVAGGANGPGAIIGALCGAAGLFCVQRFTHVHLLLYATVGIVLCFVAGYAASFLFPRLTGSTHGLTIYDLRP